MRAFKVGVSLSTLALSWQLASCGAAPSETESTSDLQMFFENSTRRDPNALEREQTVNVGGCTAFYVKNTAGKAILASARHCFNGSITNWCNGGGRFTQNDGLAGTCKRVVAADTTHDIALFEGDITVLPSNDRALSLAAYEPRVSTRLKMIGYPADQYRRAALTTTENCWILQSRTSSPHGGALNDRSSRHNCTTYGGNSGGPMLQEGTDVAVGLPFTYAPGDYTNRSATNLGTSSHMAQMADLVATHRATLEAEGIVIIDAQPAR